MQQLKELLPKIKPYSKDFEELYLKFVKQTTILA